MPCLITMSQKELHRLELIQQIRGRSLTVVEAAALLGLSRSQVHRLLQAYELAGADGLVSKKRGRPSNRRHSEDFRNLVRHGGMRRGKDVVMIDIPAGA
jgi:transposase